MKKYKIIYYTCNYMFWITLISAGTYYLVRNDSAREVDKVVFSLTLGSLLGLGIYTAIRLIKGQI